MNHLRLGVQTVLLLLMLVPLFDQVRGTSTGQ